jgi:hypothetical protein
MTGAPRRLAVPRRRRPVDVSDEERKDTFPDSVDLLEMRMTGEDELVEPQFVILEDSLSYLRVVAHECSATTRPRTTFRSG